MPSVEDCAAWDGEVHMRSILRTLVGATVLATTASSVATPAFALGGCGPNGHRNRFGYCVFGGQNQAWCLRTRGRPATRMPDGTLRCI